MSQIIDIAAVRADTEFCEDMIHFNNAGASLMPKPVYQAVTGHLALECEVGGYEAETLSQQKVEGFYTAFAELLGADPDEIAYVENATRAWDMAFYALPLSEGDRILTHASEYASNFLAFLHLAKKKGIEIDLIPSDTTGQIDVEALEGMIKPRTRVIAITHVPTQGGLVNPVAEVGAVARKHNLIYLLDACQSVGQMPVHVKNIGCDILSGTGRKFLRGPRGTGFLYINKKILSALDPPFIDLHAANWLAPDKYELRNDARRFENWESYVAGRIGLAAAVEYASHIGLEAIHDRINLLASALRQRLADIPGVQLHDQGKERCAIVTFTKKNEEPAFLAKRLRSQKINISVSPINYARLDFEARNLSALARASVHYYNTQDEIERFCNAVASKA